MAALPFDAGRALPRTIAACPVPVSYGKRLWRFCRIANYRVRRRFLFALFNGVGGQQTLGGLCSTHGTPRTRGPGKLLGLPRTAAHRSGQCRFCLRHCRYGQNSKRQICSAANFCRVFARGKAPFCRRRGRRARLWATAKTLLGQLATGGGQPARLFLKKTAAQG